MAKLVGLFPDQNKFDAAKAELDNLGYSIKKISKSLIRSMGLEKEIKPIYINKLNEGNLMGAVDEVADADLVREVFENHGAEQIRTV